MQSEDVRVEALAYRLVQNGASVPVVSDFTAIIILVVDYWRLMLVEIWNVGY